MFSQTGPVENFGNASFYTSTLILYLQGKCVIIQGMFYSLQQEKKIKYSETTT